LIKYVSIYLKSKDFQSYCIVYEFISNLNQDLWHDPINLTRFIDFIVGVKVHEYVSDRGSAIERTENYFRRRGQL